MELNNTYPLISVAMITYGHESYIKKAIESVLMQKGNFDLELIITNDCSLDNTDAIVQEILDNHKQAKRIRYFSHRENKGVISNFNWTLNQCQGKYIALCEGDDYWTDPLKLQKQMEMIQNNKNTVIITHKTKVIEEGVEAVDVFKIDWKKTIFTSFDYVTRQFFHTTSYLFRREYMQGFKLPKNIMSGDIPLMMYLLSDNRKGIMIDEVMSVYRRHPNGFTHDMERKRNKLIKMYQMWLFIRSFNLDRKTKKNIDIQLGNFARSIIRQTYKANFTRAAYFFIMSLYHDPVFYVKKIKNRIYE